MQSKSGHFIVILTILVVAGVGLNYFFAQAGPPTAPSASIVVDITDDVLANDGDCSLREAILSANSDSAIGGCVAGQGADIVLLGSETYTLSLAGADEDASNTGDLDITDDLEIRGSGSSLTVVSANGIDRVFHIDPTKTGVNVKLTDITVQGGSVDLENKDGGGGICSNGDLVLDGVIVRNSLALRGGGVRVSTSGSLEIVDSLIEGNIASGEGGGIYGDAPITLDSVQLKNNQASRGGGVFCDFTCDFLDITISENQAGSGGGVYNDAISTFLNVTIDQNEADSEGGGIFSEAGLALTNVTISGNFAENGGSGLYSESIAHLRNVTIYENSSIPGTWAGLSNDPIGSLDLRNTIIANNYPYDCSGDLVSLGYNLASDDSCEDLQNSSDFQNTDPQLFDLADNGGKTETHALNFNSPAVDGGTNSGCVASDQRYFSRPADGDGDGSARCDIGAYEAVPGGAFRIFPLFYTVDEDDGSVVVSVERVEGLVGQVSVDYLTFEGFSENRANQDADYIGEIGTLTWANNDSSVKYITIDIVDDNSYEPNEIFYVQLRGPKGGASIVSTHREALITILESDIGSPAATPVPDPERSTVPIIPREW